MSQQTAVQTTTQTGLPTPGLYEADITHSAVSFTARHLMVSKVRGRFASFSATINVAQKPEDSSVEATIGAASIDTGTQMRDDHLRSADFFDVERFPALTFRSTKLEQTGVSTFDLHGDLTIKDVTRPVVLHGEYLGAVIDPWGSERFAAEARTEINREDFDITWNQALEAGGVVVGKRVTIELEIEAVKKS